MQKSATLTKYIISAMLAVCLFFNTMLSHGSLSFISKADDSISADTYVKAVNAIIDGAYEQADYVDISNLNIPSSYAEELYFDALYTDPGLFHVSADFSLSENVILDSDKNIEKIKISYVKTLYDINGKYYTLQRQTGEFLKFYSFEEMNTAEKYLAVFEYIISKVSPNTNNTVVSSFGSSAYGALVEESADSRGYALAFKQLANALGLGSIIIVSKTNKNVCWNAVEIDGAYYYIDAFKADGEFDTKLGSSDVYVDSVDHYMFLSDISSFAVLGHESGTNYGYGDPIKALGSASPKFKRFWTGVESHMAYYDGYWYCVSNKNNSLILKRSPNNEVVGINETAFYTNSNPIGYLAIEGSTLYFTNLDAEVYAIDLDASSVTATEVFDAYDNTLKIKDLFFNDRNIEVVLVDTNGSAAGSRYFSDGKSTDSTVAVTYGDLNGDKKITTADLSILQEYIKNGTAIESAYSAYADIDRNGVIDTMDRVYLARYLAGEAYIKNTYFS